MPLYLGHPNNGQQTVSDALLSRGIDLLRAKPSDVTIIACVEYTQPAFSSYFANLPAFIAAQETKQVTDLRREGFLIATKTEDSFPLELPDVITDFAKPLSQDQLDKLGVIGYQQITLQNKKTAMVFSHPTLETVRFLMSLKANPISRATQNTVNINCVGSLMLVRRIFSGFFRTHSYPAFTDQDHTIPFDDFPDVFESAKNTKRKRVTEDVGNESAHGEEEVGSPRDIDMAEPPAPISFTDSITLFRAKPHRSTTQPWGSTDEIPTASGILFPFAPMLAVHDGSLVPHIIHRYFFKCLGTTFGNAHAAYEKLKSAWGNIHTTMAGDALSHMAKMIDLAGQTQARVFPVFDGGMYAGSVLSGARFALSTNSKVYRPIAYSDLRVEMVGAKFHTAVLESISRYTSDVGLRSSICTATSMRALSEMVRSMELTEEHKDAVRKESVHLNFKTKYLAAHPSSIRMIMGLMKNTSERIPYDLPMHPSFLFENDRVASLLSAFGYQAPTFLIPSCPIIKLVAGVDPPKTFVFRFVAMNAAIADWRVLIESKMITNSPQNLSKSFKDRSLNGDAKKGIWLDLLDLVSAQGVVATSNPGEPRDGLGVNGGSEGEDPFAF